MDGVVFSIEYLVVSSEGKMRIKTNYADLEFGVCSLEFGV